MINPTFFSNFTKTAKYYANLPNLEEKMSIQIAKIGIYHNIPYRYLTDQDSNEFPKGKNPALEYMENEKVDPVIIVDTDGKTYKTPVQLWFPLQDVVKRILRIQFLTGRKIFPRTIYIDKMPLKNNTQIQRFSCIWLKDLFNLGLE